nr:hypothetical protein [Pseudomonas sp. CVAP\
MDSFDPRLIAVRSAHFIAGQYRDAQPGLEVVRPLDGQVYAQLPIVDADLVDEAFEANLRFKSVLIDIVP